MGKPIPVVVPNIDDQEVTREKMYAIYAAARRERLLEADLPTGVYETDSYSPPPQHYKRKNR